jgi:hypothetical protein
MTVCTNDVAHGDLVQHGLPVAVADALRDVEALVPGVVELQDERIYLAAVHARPLAEERYEERGALGGDSSLAPEGVRDVLVAMRCVVLAFVFRPTCPAVVVALLASLSAPGEVR